MDKKIEILLYAMAEVVNDDSLPYKVKIEKIKTAARTLDGQLDFVLEEFTSWFEDGFRA
jgi:hypothetical protein